MKKADKITVTLRLCPEDALAVLTYCRSRDFINDKQYIGKTKVAMEKITLS